MAVIILVMLAMDLDSPVFEPWIIWPRSSATNQLTAVMGKDLVGVLIAAPGCSRAKSTSKEMILHMHRTPYCSGIQRLLQGAWENKTSLTPWKNVLRIVYLVMRRY
jgi:hypothetical protein